MPGEAKHTPGPWHLAEEGSVWAATPQGAYTIARCEDLDTDACLIAAAPDLLAACEAVAEQECTCADDEAGGFELPCLACRCERAVFKALGREGDRVP